MISKDRVIVPALEGAAVDTFFTGGILLMRSNLDAIERAVILFAAVILAVVHGTADTVVRIIVLKHIFTSI